jgi:hypothetical protein
LGIRHIINLGLHSHEKALPDEAASVSRLGMTYIHIPVDFQNPTDGDFAQFCSVIERLNRHSPDSRRFEGQDRAFEQLGQRQIAASQNKR